MNSPSRWKRRVVACLSAAGIVGLIASCGNSDDGGSTPTLPVGPANAGTPPAHTLGNAANGRTVFRFETFGNERFWTDAVRLPAGMVAANVTPLQALQLGLHVDIDAVPAADPHRLMVELAPIRPGGLSIRIIRRTQSADQRQRSVRLPAKDTTATARSHPGRRQGRRELRAVPTIQQLGRSVPTALYRRRRDGPRRTSRSASAGVGTIPARYYPVLQRRS